jgi:hypothetical protein
MDSFVNANVNIIDPLKNSRRNNINNYFNYMCEVTGYKPITTFWDDFTIADRYGVEGIKDTYKRATREWQNDCKFYTELVMVLNWKCWYHNEIGNNEYSQLYADFYYEAYEFGLDKFTGDELTYFWSTLD